MVLELYCRLGGIPSKDKTHAKEVIDEILLKYRDRYRAIVNEKKVQESYESNTSSFSKEVKEEIDEVNSREATDSHGN